MTCDNAGGSRRAIVTQPAPDFKATAVMADGSFKDISLSDYKGKYVLLYFYPLDFTFVCPSEILAFDRMVEEFRLKDVVVLGCSTDSHFCHFAWRNTPKGKGGIGPIKHPLISDLNQSISKKYNVLLEEVGISLRGLFLIDREGVLRHQVINDLPLGRNVEEAMRMVDALQNFELNGEVCPANWRKGAKAMKPTPEGVAEYLTHSS